MVIELEPAARDFDRYWVTGGADDFVEATRQWTALHSRCGDGQSTTHLKVTEPSRPSRDGLRRVWLRCACGRRRLILGPPTGGRMEPCIPRRGQGVYVRSSQGASVLLDSLPDALNQATALRATGTHGAVWIERGDQPANTWTTDDWWAWHSRREWSTRPLRPGVH